jgi:hypothetical protein
MAAAALFVLIAGLTLLTFLVLGGKASPQGAMVVFFPFFLTGLLLFAASAMIDTEIVKAFLNAATPLKGGGK